MTGESVPLPQEPIPCWDRPAKFRHTGGPRPGQVDRTALLHQGAVVWGDATVAAHAVIMPQSVVYDNVPPRAVMRGNPATLIDLACDCGEMLDIGRVANMVTDWLTGAKRLIPLDGGMEIDCPTCGRRYNAGAICAEVVIDP